METRQASFSSSASQPIEIRCDNGSVTVRDGPAGSVAVTTTLRHPGAWDYSAVEDGGAIIVTAKVKPEYRRSPRGIASFLWDSPRADIEVVASPDAIPSITVSNATVDVEGMRNGCSARASNGRVRVADCSGTLRIETSNGAAHLERLSGALTVETSNGAVHATQLDGRVDIRTLNGKVELEVALEPGTQNSVRTSNGSVAIGVAGPATVDVSVSTVNGRSSVELPSAAAASAGQRPRLEVRTTNGSVRVFEVAPVYV